MEDQPKPLYQPGPRQRVAGAIGKRKDDPIEDASSQRPTPKVQSISRRFSYAFIGVVTLLLFGFAAGAIFINISETEKELERRLEYSLNLALTSLPKALWNLDNDVVDDFVEALFLDDAIVHAKVLWANQVIIERTREDFQRIDFSDPTQSSRFMLETSDITFEEDKVGAIQIAMSRESVRDELILNISGIIALTILIIMGISLTSVAITRRYISRPLLQLQNSATSIARGDLEAPIETSGRDEIGTLARNLKAHIINLSPCNCSIRRISSPTSLKSSNAGQIICYIDRSYPVLATPLLAIHRIPARMNS